MTQTVLKYLPRIILDERERGEIRHAFDPLPCTIQIETLPLGDYLISPDIAIERKRGDDFIGSLCDNRLFSQLTKLKQYYASPIIILEAPVHIYRQKRLHPASLRGAMVYISFKMGIPIIPSRNAAETARMIWSLAKAVQRPFFDAGEPFTYVPRVIPDVPVGKLQQLHFLQGLAEVSEKRSAELLATFGTPGQVVDAILETEIIYTASGKMKGIDGSLKRLKGYGAKFITKNKRVLRLPFEVAKKHSWK